MDSFGWEAKAANGDVYTSNEHRSVRNIPAGVGITEIQAWVKGDPDPFVVPLQDGDEFDILARRQGIMGGGPNDGHYLGIVVRREGHEEWSWLFTDGTVAATDHDPMTREWGWEDFIESVNDARGESS